MNGKETIAFLLLNGKNPIDDVLQKRIDDVSKTFKNAFIIYIGSTIQWTEIETIQRITSNCLLFACNILQAVDILVNPEKQLICRHKSVNSLDRNEKWKAISP